MIENIEKSNSIWWIPWNNGSIWVDEHNWANIQPIDQISNEPLSVRSPRSNSGGDWEKQES
jgi:hypothetical protein